MKFNENTYGIIFPVSLRSHKQKEGKKSCTSEIGLLKKDGRFC